MRLLTTIASFGLGFFAITPSVQPPKPTARHIELDAAQATKPLDRFSTWRSAPTFPAP